MRSHFRKLVTFVVLAATLTVSASALADDKRGPGYTESKDQAGQVVKFTDDPLGATGLDPNIPRIGVRKPGQRSQAARRSRLERGFLILSKRDRKRVARASGLRRQASRPRSFRGDGRTAGGTPTRIPSSRAKVEGSR